MSFQQILFLIILTCITLPSGLSFTLPHALFFVPRANVRILNEESYDSTSPTSTSALSYSNGKENDTNDNSDDSAESDLAWFRKMKMSQEEFFAKESEFSLPLDSGIAGFAIDQELGFVCVLVDEYDEDEEAEIYEDDYDEIGKSQHNKKMHERSSTKNRKFTYAVVSPTDTKKLSSAEALCLIQLAGDLDLGSAVFPPETFARLVATELENDDGDDDDDDYKEINVEELRSKITLVGVKALKNEKYSPKEMAVDHKNEAGNKGEKSMQSSPERNAKIEEGSPKMLPAIQSLPGLAEVTTEEIISAMQIHADAHGKLDRNGFSELLGTLRGGNASHRMEEQKVKFRITAIVEGSDPSSPSRFVDVDHVPAFQAVALAMRYKVAVNVSKGCFDNEVEDCSYSYGDVLKRFPVFKPAQELVKDAKIMDGFISTMFYKKKPPKNDDKA
jgi:hypothetical protein